MSSSSWVLGISQKFQICLLNKMRTQKSVLIATGIFPPSIGGPATYSKMLQDELPKYGIKSDVLSFDSVRWLPKGVRHVLYFLKLWLRAGHTDIIYAQDPVSVGWPASLVAKLRNKPFYLRVPGDYAWEQACQKYGVTDLLDIFVMNKNYPKSVLQLKRIEKKVAMRAVKIIVPSEYLKGIVTKWGIAGDKIIVIANALEGEVPQESKEILRSELALRHKTIISAGRLVPWKGFKALIEGLSGYLKEKEVDLIIVGSGPDEEGLKEVVKSNGLQDRVTLLGSLPRRDLLRYVKASDVFVLNTAYEGFSHQILEAMAVGTPVVTTNVGGNPEVIEDSVHGFLVDLNDLEAFRVKTDLLLTDTALAENIRARALQRASIFSKGTALQKLVSELQ